MRKSGIDKSRKRGNEDYETRDSRKRTRRRGNEGMNKQGNKENEEMKIRGNEGTKK